MTLRVGPLVSGLSEPTSDTSGDNAYVWKRLFFMLAGRRRHPSLR